jgi:hypothetical protein
MPPVLPQIELRWVRAADRQAGRSRAAAPAPAASTKVATTGIEPPSRTHAAATPHVLHRVHRGFDHRALGVDQIGRAPWCVFAVNVTPLGAARSRWRITDSLIRPGS